MSTLKISDLWIYPIKSLAGIQLTTSKVENRGLEYDRRWVLVDENGVFVNQREFPEMNFLQPEIDSEIMTIRHKQGKLEPLSISMSEPNVSAESVVVWDDTCSGKPVDSKADEWFSKAINKPVRLLFMHKKGVRPADPRYAITESDEVSYADCYPVLIISEASLVMLNSKTDVSIPMNRFRPNIVISGATAHQEDELREIEVNGLKMYGVKPSARCVMTTIDINTGQRGKEPLKTLATYRKTGHKILFGENFIPAAEGTVNVGDEITVKEKKSTAFD